MLLACNVALKLALVGLIAHSLLLGDAPQFRDKAMLARQLLFPVGAMLVPAWWHWRRPAGRYPHLLDALVTMPFVIDLAGNATNAYDSIEYFDDAVHACNPAVIVLVIALLAARSGLRPAVALLLAVGAGSIGHTLFELVEYRLFTGGNSRLALSLPDTLSDLGWGLVGSTAGATAGILLARRQPQT